MKEKLDISSQRKTDHLDLALESRLSSESIDPRFYYEPILDGHPSDHSHLKTEFLGKALSAPIWISSMTGGTAMAGHINENLARACHDFGLGMGLGSCRSLLFDDQYMQDFDVRDTIGDSLPLYGNLGIAQVESLIAKKELYRIDSLIEALRLDGLIIHVNPMQEWFQPEGDQINSPPLDTIKRLLEVADYPIIVKEVGQGMGMQSLEELFTLPLAAIDFGASGGTNFALLELLRSSDPMMKELEPLVHVGHSALEMVQMSNEINARLALQLQCKEVIISGGIENFLDGYYLVSKMQMNAIYGQASAFLKYAKEDYATLYRYVNSQIDGLSIAKTFLKVK